MSAAAYIAGYAAAGLGVRIWQLGIQGRNLSSDFRFHLTYMTAGAGFGYWIHGKHQRNLAILKYKIDFTRARQDAEAEYREKRIKKADSEEE